MTTKANLRSVSDQTTRAAKEITEMEVRARHDKTERLRALGEQRETGHETKP